MNFLAIAVAALIPNILGMLWYNPKVFGSIWQKETGVSMSEGNNTGNFIKIMIISLILCFLIAFALHPITIHQWGVYSSIMTDKSIGEALDKGAIVDITLDGKAMNAMGNFRTFGHGALHGTIIGIFLILPIIAISSMYEKRSWRYILISSFYWIVNLALMGGVICGWK